VSVRSELQQLAVREFLLWNKTWIAISWIRPSALSINFALPVFTKKSCSFRIEVSLILRSSGEILYELGLARKSLKRAISASSSSEDDNFSDIETCCSFLRSYGSKSKVTT